ncbi:MAG: DUF4339 domain-containing protein [Verrucomicrobiales bacterium]|nr:DUF4339 domain-containing protein [Verrucomicrobiales bacterium]
MTEWYYARAGQQSGPVDFDQLKNLAGQGQLDPVNDLVWNASMANWQAPGTVAGLFNQGPPAMDEGAFPVAPVPSQTGSNPYATPDSTWTQPYPLDAGQGPGEIVPGSDPLDVMAVIRRGFELTKRHFGTIFLVGFIYIVISFGVGFLTGFLDSMLGLQTNDGSGPINGVVSQLVSIFLGLGLTRVGLNLVSGQPVEVAQLFGEGSKFLRALGGSILFGLAIVLGLILLIVPGIYLALRYGQFLNAIVDKDMGVMESFQYSASITTNNLGNLFGLAVLGILIVIAGILALLVGVVFAYPVVWLSGVVAYRWMRFGRAVVQDQTWAPSHQLT